MRTLLYKAAFRLNKHCTQKTIMTTPHNLQQVMDDLKNNPYFDKYSNKIQKLQQSSPEEFTSKIEGIANKKKPIEAPSKSTPERSYSQLLNPKKQLSDAIKDQQQESLDKIMKFDLIKDKTAEEIKSIWQEYHINKDFISAVIPPADFKKLQEKGKKHPVFLFPLPRSQGFEFIMCQFDRNTVHFTPLLYYQVHKENAPECLTIVHYTELLENKGMVLMRGEYDKNVINSQEAQCLANQLKLYYTEDDPEKNRLLYTFTNKPDEFKHSELIKQVENISL